MMNDVFKQILDKYTLIPNVEAIAIGGSTSANTFDNNSDIDVYIFTKENIPIELRQSIILPISSNHEIGGEYFGSGDEFWVDLLNKQLDVMYWDINWFEQVVENVWFKFYPQNGYTTCFLYTLKNFNIIYDKSNWLQSLKEKIATPYPQRLKENIVNRNMMLMKDKPFASYYEQIEKAILRKDIVNVNNRISAFLSSYFDIIFAINELLHPGEKRLIKYAKKNCKVLPNNFEENINKLLVASHSEILDNLELIIEELRKIII